MAHIAEYKKKKVQEFIRLMKDYPIIAAVDMENLPTPQLQNMRAQLREKVVLKMTKRRFMNLAFEKAQEFKPGINKMVEHLKGMPALLFTRDNPFTLYKILQKNKSPAPAKAGQIAPRDIVIPAGPTPFAPGPLIGELGMLGLKTGVEGGKIAIKENKVVVKEGEEIKPKVAGILTRFDIKPMEIGLGLTAAYEDGTIFTAKVLHIEEGEYEQKLANAGAWALNLAVEIGYPTKDNIELMLNKAHNDSKALAISENVLTSETVENVLAKAEGHGQSIQAHVSGDVKEEVKEEVKTEPIKEEPKEEVKEEPVKEVKEVPEQTEEVKEEPAKEESKEEKPVEEPKEQPQLEQAIQEPKQEEVVIESKQGITDKDMEKAARVVEQIKKGTMNIEAQDEDVKPIPSAEDLVNELKAKDEAKKQKQETQKVPTAHELLQKKLKKQKEEEEKSN